MSFIYVVSVVFSVRSYLNIVVHGEITYSHCISLSDCSELRQHLVAIIIVFDHEVIQDTAIFKSLQIEMSIF